MGGRGGSGNGLNINNAGGVKTIINGRETVYAIRNGKLQNVSSLQFIPSKQDVNSLIGKLVDSGATLLSKAQINKITSDAAQKRSNRPDYETGNPFGERAKGKTVYRPRRRRN